MVSRFTHRHRLLDDATRARLLTTIAWLLVAITLIEIPLFAFLLDPELRWVAWVCAYFLGVSLLVIIAVRAGFVSIAGMLYAAAFTMDLVVADAESLVSRPGGIVLILPIVIIGITTTFDAAALFAGLVIIFLVLLPFAAGIAWDPWITANVAMIIIVVFLLWHIARLFEELQERNQQLRLAQTQAEQVNAELTTTNQVLESANARLRTFSAQAADLAVEQERTRLAREIHDGLGQHLDALTLYPGIVEQSLEQPDQIRAPLQVVQAEAEAVRQEVRRAINALLADHTAARLEDLLAPDVHACVLGGISIETESLGTPRALPPTITHNLHRMAQEALNNVRRHSFADQARLILDYRDPEKVRLTVSDDGLGFDPHDPSAGRGLTNLRERAALIGGTLDIRTTPGEGVTVTVEVPLCDRPSGS